MSCSDYILPIRIVYLYSKIKLTFTLHFFFIYFFHYLLLRCAANRTQGKADSINIDQFINFLNEKQRDPRLNEILYPLYEEKRAIEIINSYEQDEEARGKST